MSARRLRAPVFICLVPVNGDYDVPLIAASHDEYRDMDLLAYDLPVVDTRNLISGKHALCYGA